VATLVGFAAVIVLCLGFAGTWLGRVANAGIWSVWEPTVFALFLLVGPVWCTVCPLSTAARLAKGIGSRDRPPPGWMVRHGPWLAIVGFVFIIWVERVFHSVANPVASGLLLLGLVLAAVLGAVLWRREVWCRHLCPLGRLGTALAPAAPLQLSAQRQVCASSCTTHACFKGTPEVSGCSVFHHPLEGKQSYRCKLCLDCLRSCPHGSTQLQVRPPVAALWNLDSGAADIAMFATAIALLALGLAAVRAVPALAGPVPFTILCLGAVGAGVLLHHVMMRLAGDETRTVSAVRVAMVMMLLGWAALMASQLANVGLLAGARVVLPPAEWMPGWVPTELGVLGLLQVVLVAGTAMLVAIALGQIRAREGGRRTTLGWLAVGSVLTAYAAALVAFLLV
jgi:polyferredoxin